MDHGYIKSVIQRILDSKFTQPEKRRVNEFADRINFACPYCLDSHKNIYAKRGNVWFNKLIFVCFNCDKRANFDKVAKDNGVVLDPEKKLEIIRHLDSVVSYKDFEDDVFETQLEKLVEMADIEEFFNTQRTFITEFREVQVGGVVYNYLKDRKITNGLLKNIYQGKYWTSPSKWEWVIIFLNRRGSKVLGMQARNLKSGKSRFFKIYNFETIYKWVKGVDDIEDIDVNQLVIYNKLSYYFNILNVDFSEKITIFEGYLDSLFFPNSIGVVGVNTDMRFLESNNLDLQYFYDNDNAGNIKSEQKIKVGYNVFLWKKLFDYIVSMKKTDDPYGLLYRINKVKDLNKLSELVEDPYSKLSLNNFFSKDLLDIRWIPKREKWTPKKVQKSY